MRPLVPLLLLGACAAPDDGDEADTDATWFADGGFSLADAHANVLREFSFTREESDGVAPGFDLDGLDSPAGDPASCGHGDLIDPDGVPGIDNQLAAIWTLAAPLIGEQVEELLQGAINEGRMLMVVELVGVDDLRNDDDLSLRLFRGAADPELGTLGLIAPDQTYAVDPSTPEVVLDGLSLRDGFLEAGPVAFDLPIDILEARFDMPVSDGRIRLRLDEQGAMHGLIGGIVDVRTMLDELLATDAAAETELVAPIFENNADMRQVDGTCTGFSVAFGFDGTPGFVVRYPEDAAAE
ncbi:MAG: hypothetical protein H6732_07665 [Alphaproteobacteria bacterium]|nr:hypothetical protein [Alphaproteobacteria bacterium]